MRIGTVAYATRQGLAYLAKSFYDAGVITDVLIFRHPGGYVTYPEMYPPGTPILDRRPFAGPAVDAFLEAVDAVIFFETPFDWSFVNRCRQAGVRTILMPMMEWWPVRPPDTFDLYLCPSKLDFDIFKDKGRAVYLPVPVDPATWRLRTRAKTFLHNAGHLGSNHHKGTDAVLDALPLCRQPLSLTVRCQSSRFHAVLAAHPQARSDPRLQVEIGDIPYERLFAAHDVYVAPEKYNGLSLPLQEARASGMYVLSTDRYPANDWLPREGLIPSAARRMTRVAAGYLPVEESVVDPAAVAEAMDALFDQDISAYSESGREWAMANSWDALKPRYMEAIQELVGT